MTYLPCPKSWRYIPYQYCSGLTLQHCSSTVKMFYSKIKTGSSKSVRKEGNMHPRNTIHLPVLKSLCSYYSALGHVRVFPAAGNTKGPDWALCESCRSFTLRGVLALPELCCSCGCRGTSPVEAPLLTCPFNSTSTLFSPLFLFQCWAGGREGACVW